MIGIGISELYFLVPANLFLLIVFYKSKFPRYLFLFLLVVLSYSYIDMADYNGYLEMYDAPKGNLSGQYFLESTDIGFRFFVYLGNFLNLEFEFFKASIYFIFGIVLINGLVRINNKSANLVLSLYVFYPLILDLVQIRHFMAMATFIYAVSFYLISLKKNDIKLRNYIYFIPTLLLHISFAYLVLLIFLSYILLRYINTNNFVLKNIYILFTSFLLLSVILFFLNISNLTYLSTKTSISTIIFYSIVYFIFYFLFIAIRSKTALNYRIEYNFVLIYTTILIGTTLPMLFYHVEFFRFFRVELLILLSLMFSVTLSVKNIFDRFYTIIIYMTYVFLSVIIFYTYYLDNLIYPLLFIGSLK